MKINLNRNRNLSHINNLEDLHKEILRVREDIKVQERQLEERAKRLPAEAMKAGAGAAFPFIVNNVVAARTFGIVKNVAGLFLGGSKEKVSTGKKLFSAAKQLGIATAIKAGFNFIRKRRSKKHAKHRDIKKEKK